MPPEDHSSLTSSDTSSTRGRSIMRHRKCHSQHLNTAASSDHSIGGTIDLNVGMSSSSSMTMTPSPSPSPPTNYGNHTAQHQISSHDDADVAAGKVSVIMPLHGLTEVDCSSSSTKDTTSIGYSNGSSIHTMNQTQSHPVHSSYLSVPMGSSSSTDGSAAGANTPSKNEDTKANSHRVTLLGFDISQFSRRGQFLACAGGLFSFSLCYGYLQELISVTLCSRQLGLFVAMIQFSGYTLWSALMKAIADGSFKSKNTNNAATNTTLHKVKVPMHYYLGLSILRAIDACMTNMAMAYVNYPAKTLLKSSRVVFTMLFSTILSRKRYKPIDYLIVSSMVAGLVIFMHADSRSSAVFQPIGIIMLVISLLCDGVFNNLSEKVMRDYGVGQDEFIFRLYSIATIGILGAAIARGDFREGLLYMMTPGTYNEIQELKLNPTHIASTTGATWSVGGKMLVVLLFSSTGFFGSSCSSAITKEFGALTMSITSTARKATTLFISFAMFHNTCTVEHILGIVFFISALITKSLRVSRGGSSGSSKSSGTNGTANKMEDGGEQRGLHKSHSSSLQLIEEVRSSSTESGNESVGDMYKEHNGCNGTVEMDDISSTIGMELSPTKSESTYYSKQGTPFRRRQYQRVIESV